MPLKYSFRERCAIAERGKSRLDFRKIGTAIVCE